MELFLALLPILAMLIWALGGLFKDTVRDYGWWFLISSLGWGALISGWIFFWMFRI